MYLLYGKIYFISECVKGLTLIVILLEKLRIRNWGMYLNAINCS